MIDLGVYLKRNGEYFFAAKGKAQEQTRERANNETPQHERIRHL